MLRMPHIQRKTTSLQKLPMRMDTRTLPRMDETRPKRTHDIRRKMDQRTTPKSHRNNKQHQPTSHTRANRIRTQTQHPVYNHATQ